MKRFFKVFFLTVGSLLILFAGYYFLVRKLDRDALEEKDFYVSRYDAQSPVLLPSLFINGERFYLKIPTTNGDTVLAFGDTGGGISMLMPATVDRLGLRSKVHTGLLKGLMPMKYIFFSDVVSNPTVPAPVPHRSIIVRTPVARVSESFLFVPSMDDEVKFLTEKMHLDMFLGQNYFMGKAWTFDYPNRQIWVNTPLPATEEGQPGVQKLGFKENSNHENIYAHPSTFITVNGEKIDVLFDAGASIIPSEAGKKLLNTTALSIGGSFIAASIFDRWRKDHPDWKYFEKADLGADVIEVPVVNIGGIDVGPVLFARRDDKVWSEGMIQTMDKVVKGAIGGSALKYLKVIIDYNSRLIKFSK